MHLLTTSGIKIMCLRVRVLWLTNSVVCFAFKMADLDTLLGELIFAPNKGGAKGSGKWEGKGITGIMQI